MEMFNATRLSILVTHLTARKIISGKYLYRMCLTCEVWGFHNSVTNDSSLLGCDTALLGRWLLTFQKYLSPSSSTVQGSWTHLPIRAAPQPRRPESLCLTLHLNTRWPSIFCIWLVRIKFSFYIWINMVCILNRVTHHSQRNKIVCLIMCQTVCNLPLKHFFLSQFSISFLLQDRHFWSILEILCAYFPIISINLHSANVNRWMNSMPEMTRSIYSTQNVIWCINIKANRTTSTRWVFHNSAAEEGSLLRGDASSGEYFLTFQSNVHC